MKTVYKIPLEQTGTFSSLLKDYLAQKDTLSSFAHYAPSIEGIKAYIDQLHFPAERRQVLQEVFREQYGALTVSAKIRDHIESSTSEHTFFITTGQQIHVLGGPLYVLYKIATTLKLAEECTRLMPDKKFIPLFWMASEDHDIEEINHISLFGKVYQAELKGQGPAGRISTEGLADWLNTLPDVPEVFKKAYTAYDDLASATRYWLNDLFGEQGLLVLDADDLKLKQQFIPFMEKELLERKTLEAVQVQTNSLEEKGYKGQIFPREINLFYISKEGRNRIVFEEGQYRVLNTSLVFDEKGLKKALHDNPSAFSPNVVLRPVYQQFILPNSVYVGGPAEINYWLQLGKVFEAQNIKMPVLWPRNFATIFTKQQSLRCQKLGLKMEEVFLEEEKLKQKFFEQKNYTLPEWDDVLTKLNDCWSLVEGKTLQADGGLKDWLAAEKHKIEKQLDNIEKKVHKAYEQKLDQEMKQLSGLKDKLFPGGSLQERADSFISYMINDPELIRDVIAVLDPLDFRFNLIVYED